MPNNSSYIYLLLILLGWIIRLVIQQNKESKWLDEAQKRQQTRFEYLNGKPRNTTEGDWYWDEQKKKWIPMEDIKNESEPQWRWDDQKGNWVNIEQEARKERYRKYHEGRPPTFEEWKAMREKELEDQKNR